MLDWVYADETANTDAYAFTYTHTFTGINVRSPANPVSIPVRLSPNIILKLIKLS